MWDWLDGLAGAVDQIGADIVAFLQFLLGLLIGLFQFLYLLIAAVFQFLWSVLVTVGNFFKTLWDDFFHTIFTGLYNAIVKVHDWLESILSPIVDFLKSVVKWMNWFFATYIKPILNVISQIRRFLEILRAFGIKWAATLDAALGKVQSDINGVFLKVMGYVNSLINIVNSLADPLGLFRRPTLVMSMRRIFPSFLKGVSGMPIGYFLPSPRQNPAPGTGPVQFPFNSNDPNQNPPASAYFTGDDGLGDFSGADDEGNIPDDAVDGIQPMDYFNDDLYPEPEEDDPVQALTDIQNQVFGAIAGGN